MSSFVRGLINALAIELAIMALIVLAVHFLS